MMTNGRVRADAWPAIPLESWSETFATVHMWAQIVGKVRLSLSPWVNHSWGATLYVTARGLTTSPIPHGDGAFAIDFDFLHHALRITTSRGAERSLALEPMSVAAFHRRTMDLVHELGIDAKILARPVEVEEAIPFAEDDRHAAYDAEAMHRYWRALVQAHRVLSRFRSRFIGKCSPVHFFWGAFDLAVTRFSGRTAPKHPGGAPNCADWVMVEAYSHEVSSAGFWPGPGLGEPAFYSYAYPEPEGFREHPVQPDAASYHPGLREFILPYAAVRSDSDPDALLTRFLQSTYEAAADLGRWDRSMLECDGIERFRAPNS